VRTWTLQLAERALSIPPALAAGAAYHAQQAAEKALKAFLAAHNQPFPFTHNLAVLLPLCQALDTAFLQFASVAATLTPFATQFRYPGGPLEPAAADAEQGLRDAVALVAFVRQRLGL
jgi:HEPN domain-containing protein